jgi:hypothetical protein
VVQMSQVDWRVILEQILRAYVMNEIGSVFDTVATLFEVFDEPCLSIATGIHFLSENSLPRR